MFSADVLIAVFVCFMQVEYTVLVFPAWDEREEQGRVMVAAAGAFTTSSQSRALCTQRFVPFSRAPLLN